MRVISSSVARRALLQRLVQAASPLSLLLVASSSPPRAAIAAPPPPASTGVRTRSGVQFIDFKVGGGSTPRFGQLVRFHYVGYVMGANGGELVEFDSSYARNTPYFTKHGNGYTCQGLEEAIHTMRVGGRRRVVVPAALGYTADKGPYPPSGGSRSKLFEAITTGQPVLFDVELLSAVDDRLDRGEYDQLDTDVSVRGAPIEPASDPRVPSTPPSLLRLPALALAAVLR
jgi:hypothetical protein